MSRTSLFCVVTYKTRRTRWQWRPNHVPPCVSYVCGFMDNWAPGRPFFAALSNKGACVGNSNHAGSKAQYATPFAFIRRVVQGVARQPIQRLKRERCGLYKAQGLRRGGITRPWRRNVCFGCCVHYTGRWVIGY